jgi:hypothetical protein
MVDKEKFGDRRTCYACGCKFYDMHRSPPTCPRCATDVSNPPKEIEEPEYEAPDIEEEAEEIPEDLDKESIDVDSDEEPLKEEDSDEA